MPRSSRRRTPPAHPAAEEIDLFDVLHALSDPTRMTIVRILRAEPERACGTFPVDVAPSTLSHHFKVLRESGLIRQREEANRRLTALRGAELEQRFPGLLDTVLAAHDRAAGARPEAPSSPAGGRARPPSTRAETPCRERRRRAARSRRPPRVVARNGSRGVGSRWIRPPTPRRQRRLSASGRSS